MTRIPPGSNCPGPVEFHACSTPRFSAILLQALQGRHQARLAQPGSMVKALEYFRQATEADPDYAPAWAASALTVIYLRESDFWEGVPAAEAIELAQDYINRALALDPGLAEAYVAESALHWERYRFEEALASIEQALAINPNLAGAHLERATTLVSLGRIAEARTSLLTAAELDPLDMSILRRAGLLAQDYRDLALLEEVERRLRQQNTQEARDLLKFAGLIHFRMQEQNLAEVYRRYTSAVEAEAEGSSSRRQLQSLREELGLELNHRPKSFILQGKYPALLRFIAALGHEGNEAAAWERYEDLPPALRGAPIVLEELSILQMRQGDCEAGLATLERAHGGRIPIHGQVPPTMQRSNSNLAANRVFCQRQLGRTDEAEAILARLRPYVDSLKASAPGGYDLLSIKLEIIDGRPGVAMALLESAVRQRHLWYLVWSDPLVKTLETRPEYTPLRQWLEATINAERAELGWPAGEF